MSTYNPVVDEDLRFFLGEVDDLLSSATKEERSATGRTRGMKNDAYKQERQLDQSFVETGLADAEQDVEVTAATGRGGM